MPLFLCLIAIGRPTMAFAKSTPIEATMDTLSTDGTRARLAP